MIAAMTSARNETAEAIRLLVIDDDLIQRKIICKIGAQAGYDVVEAATFDEAERSLKTQKFDCITLDLSLGKQSGALLLRTIVDSGNRVPVIVISGADEHVMQTTVKIAQSLNLESELLAKPLKLVELRSALVAKKNGVVARRGNNQLASVLRETTPGL
ncbi:MAG TPA: response regulator [Pseudolabrys sp.]|jgi:DNA-binding response OmpR family regulator